MSAITMRRGGAFDTPPIVELSCGGGPLDPATQARLMELLSYTHLYSLRGADAWDPITGEYRPTRAERKYLYHLDEQRRFCCLEGWRPRLTEELQRMGHSVQFVDLGPTHPRADRYDVNWDLVFDKIDLKPKQIEWLTAMESFDRGLIDAPPGVGKTYTLLGYCLAHHRARIHIVTEGIDILGRIHDFLTKYIANVGMVGGGKGTWGRVTCLSADSLHRVVEGFDRPDHSHSADVVIFDEVHRAGASTTLAQLARYKHCRMYGFSGSIEGRFDGAEKQLEGLFGRVIFTMTQQEAEALGMVVPVRVEWIRVNSREDPTMGLVEKTAKYRNGIWRHDFRNRAIATKVLEFADDVQVLILVQTLNHAVHLKQYLPEYKMCYAASNSKEDDRHERYVADGLLDLGDEPKMTPLRRKQMRHQFEEGTLKRVIATDVWSTGVDFPHLQVLVRADGRASDILDTQLPGRVVRTDEGKSYGLLIDCMDEWNDTFLRYSNSRKRNYIKKGWTMVGLGGRRMGTRAAAMNRR